jgi:hypothetical protein
MKSINQKFFEGFDIQYAKGAIEQIRKNIKKITGQSKILMTWKAL